MPKYILSIDEGTTGVTAMIFDSNLKPVSRSYSEFPQIFPQPGWVEHDPEVIWETTMKVITDALSKAGISWKNVACIGITNQRETTVVWDEKGRPICNAIVWQDRRTAPICKAMKKYEKKIHKKTGLVVDPYFSATKLKWILDNVDGARDLAKRKQLRFGTIDSWLVWKLSGGKSHVTDHSNASRTMLLNINRLEWDPELLELFNVPPDILPVLTQSCGEIAFSENGIPISGIAGDQQAALFGQACVEDGMVKNTYGTGCFILMTISQPKLSSLGLLTTVAWTINKTTKYALEGSVFVAGAAVQWLRDQLNIIASSSESENLATSVPDTGDVYVVPAFVGLGAPYWDPYARGIIVGITRGTNKAHITRAVLESIAFQTRDVIECMKKDGGKVIGLRVDGGAAVNNFLMQFQADILGIKVERPIITETTALGAAALAGIGAGVLSIDDVKNNWQHERIFAPAISEEEREKKYRRWREAVERARGWAKT
ncbi:MAG: glycerol kinase GlpK [Candidatus Korarchaeota archaeon]